MKRMEEMRILPILFNTDMVRAILDGRKTVTRRLVKHDVNAILNSPYHKEHPEVEDKQIISKLCIPPYQPEDILYVRETWSEWTGGYLYKAWHGPFPQPGQCSAMKWHPSLHMPKEAARIFLKVKNVRVERLQEITEEQAKAEGICRLYDDISKEEYEEWARKVGKLEKQEECSFKNYLWYGNFGKSGSGNRLSDAWEYQYSGYDNAVGSFSSLWNTTVELKDWDLYGWEANPWVWVIEFERCEKPEVE